MRLFIALTISDENKETLAHARDNFRKSIYPVTWVSDENFHVTLKFLGETDESAVCDVLACAEAVADSFNKFKLSFDCVDVLGGRNNPRSVVVKIRLGAKELEIMARALDRELVKCGFDAETRRFSPHITLGRIKKNAVSGIFDIISAYKICGMQFVDSISVVRSTLTPHGAVYDKLAVFKLN